jgi:hypothetical protein
MSDVSILNVGTGDTKLSFDKNNPAERIRAARIVRDMLRRGYALLVQTGVADGKPVYTRALDFDEDACEYLIADLDPLAAQQADAAPAPGTGETNAEQQSPGPEEAEPARAAKSKGGRRRVPAEGTKAVAVARISGG